MFPSTLRPTKSFLSFVIPHRHSVRITLLCHACHTHSPWHPSLAPTNATTLSVFFRKTAQQLIFQNSKTIIILNKITEIYINVCNICNCDVATPFADVQYVSIYLKLKVVKIILKYGSRDYSHKDRKDDRNVLLHHWSCNLRSEYFKVTHFLRRATCLVTLCFQDLETTNFSKIF